MIAERSVYIIMFYLSAFLTIMLWIIVDGKKLFKPFGNPVVLLPRFPDYDCGKNESGFIAILVMGVASRILLLG